MKKLFVALSVAIAVILTSSTVVAAKPINPRVLETVFIHYDNAARGGKPSPSPVPKVYDVYKLLGPRWDLTRSPGGVSYVINPSGAPAGAATQVIAGFEAWDAATGADLFNDSPVVDGNSWWGRLDGKNNISWQVIPDGGIIAGTWLWYADNDNSGTMSPGDEILETDMVFNASKQWAIDLDGEGTTYKLKNAYDVRDISTHEAGHVVGLDDLYAPSQSEITMYGYSSKGETKKISLEIGDKRGTVVLYGS